MKKRLLIVTNHSYMFWQFGRELAEALQKEYEVILAMPFVGHEEDFRTWESSAFNIHEPPGESIYGSKATMGLWERLPKK